MDYFTLTYKIVPEQLKPEVDKILIAEGREELIVDLKKKDFDPSCRIELVGGDIMTLFTPFYVPEGIVIVSDSRITIRTEGETTEREILSDKEQKIFLLRNNEVGMVYTADNMPEGFTMVEFVKNMNKFIVKPNDSILDLTSKIKHYINGVENIKVSIVIAGFDNEDPYVYLIENQSIKILNRDTKNKIAYGATVGGNLKRVNQLFDYNKSYSKYSLKESLKYGYFLVEDSIEYLNALDEYSNVGGNIQHVLIRKTGGVELVR